MKVATIRRISTASAPFCLNGRVSLELHMTSLRNHTYRMNDRIDTLDQL